MDRRFSPRKILNILGKEDDYSQDSDISDDVSEIYEQVHDFYYDSDRDPQWLPAYSDCNDDSDDINDVRKACNKGKLNKPVDYPVNNAVDYPINNAIDDDIQEVNIAIENNENFVQQDVNYIEYETMQDVNISEISST